VKQRCESNQFLAINDKLEMDARVFISNKWNGGKSKTVERQTERECERQSIAGQEKKRWQ
jgi:hypothetical protein